MPRFAERCELPPPPPDRKDGLFATAGRAPELPALPAPALVAMAVGKTKEGESLPAKPKIGQSHALSSIPRYNISILDI